MTRRSQHYPPELRERAVRMVAEVTSSYESQWAAIGAVAQKLGIGSSETVRKWVASRCDYRHFCAILRVFGITTAT